jgi:isoleucyl-tRNA synthetase
LHPDFEYAAVEHNGEVFIVAEGRIPPLREKLGIEGKVLLHVRGKSLEGMEAGHPFLGRTSKVILAAFVSLEEGTGIVHIAPGHGEDDYDIGLKYGLDIYAPVDRFGKFRFSGNEESSPLQGQFVFKANNDIIAILKDRHALLDDEKIVHSYPHCWRCKKPVIFRATAQWFISMDKNELREKCLAEIGRTQWIPGWGRERIHGMIQGRPDWCISRQRAWGVPITLIRCRDCDEFVTESNILSHIVNLVEEQSSDVWFMKNAGDFLPKGYSCGKCGGTSFDKETDILDVWFDSGVSHAAVVEAEGRLSWPADMYLEGSDQHRGWFQSSLLASVGTRGKSPYRTVLTHGFVVDGQGKKMSKSLGNVVAPQEVIKINGAEILRLWVSAEDYKDDIRISKEIIDRLTEAYRKIRNTCRFLLGNMYDFDGKDYSANLLEIDAWAMSRLQSFTRKVTSGYEHYDFHETFHSIYHFCVVDMSSFYLDVLKDRLYTFGSVSEERRAAQWVLYNILTTMTRLMAPIISFTAEEVWQDIRRNIKGEVLPESVFLADCPVPDEKYLNADLERKWEPLFLIRNEVNKALEVKRAERFLGNSLEAKVTLSVPGQLRTLLTEYIDFLPAFFIASSVEITDTVPEGSYKSTEIEGLAVGISRAPGEKCQRCWNWSERVGTFEQAPEICERCYQILFTPE